MNSPTSEHPENPPAEHPDHGGATAPAKPAAGRASTGAVRAAHGYVSEVRWQTGQGRQPYSNRGAQEAPPPNLGDEFEAGDRGPYSGNTLDQMERVKQKP